jgi:probable HAF family extracellular repeat protein
MSQTAEGEFHAFITGPDGVGMRDLGTLGPPGPFANLYSSTAYGINDAGQVVGWFETGGHRHAFITGPDGMGMMDLNSLVDLPGGVPLAAKGINNSGQIIAVAIPEPESYALLLAGVALIGVVVRRKKDIGLQPEGKIMRIA